MVKWSRETYYSATYYFLIQDGRGHNYSAIRRGKKWFIINHPPGTDYALHFMDGNDKHLLDGPMNTLTEAKVRYLIRARLAGTI
jgi:hypothetical protein